MLPKNIIYKLSYQAMMLYYRKKPKRTEILNHNISKAFPDMNQDDVRKLGRDSYEEVSKTIAETILSYQDRIDLNKIIKENREAFDKLKELNKNSKHGTVVITAHYGNWELLGQVLSKGGFSSINVVKKNQKSLIDTLIITPFRERYGMKMINYNRSMIAITRGLKSGKNISLMIDQMVQPPNGIGVNLFDRYTTATKSVAVLKKKYDPIIVPIFLARGDNGFTLVVDDPIETLSSDNQNNEESIRIMTQQYYDTIEKQIRKDPKQWLWLYNRWKSIKELP